MAFDERWLAERRQKEAGWASKGIRTGSGRDWSSEEAQRALAATSKLPKRSKGKGKPPADNPHAVALAHLAKNPTLRHGGTTPEGKRIPASYEHWEQVMLFDWVYRYHNEYYLDMAAVPNGSYRMAKTAADLLAEGQRSGYPDISVDVPAGAYHGLFIEMKYGNNKPSDNQIEQLNRKRERGYFACVCYGFEEAREVFEAYISLQAGECMSWDKNESLWLAEAV